MIRDIEKELYQWKEQKEKLPLLMRGARQVGKSYTVEAFGKKAFKNTVVINFDLHPELKDCFNTLEPDDIINKLKIVLGVVIDENTLLFFDEIQECPNAIMSLRYFKENKNYISVIGAGSLVEFALEKEDIRIPVGRVQFIYLEPLSFAEFLTASGNDQLRSYLKDLHISSEIENSIHQALMKLIREYFIVGGMPAAVKAYFDTKDFTQASRIQNALIQTYRSDFGKYAKFSEQKYLQKVFDKAPRLVGERIKFSKIDIESKSRDIKNAVNLLSLAGVIKQVAASAASGVPLGAQANDKKFKLNYLDIGLMQNACGLQAKLLLDADIMQINSGSAAEQFVGQELRAYEDRYLNRQLFFWARDKRNSSAEVDYVYEVDTHIIPIEVKAGKSGSLKSLRLFLEEKKVPFGIRFAMDKLSLYDKVLTIPLYMIEHMRRLARETMETASR
ncbi:MAG: AAA family ATPase [Elusimicrobiota bacterium]